LVAAGVEQQANRYRKFPARSSSVDGTAAPRRAIHIDDVSKMAAEAHAEKEMLLSQKLNPFWCCLIDSWILTVLSV